MKKIILHVDVNSAYLSWSAVWDLQHGSNIDIRNIPSIVGGDPENRHGIVLAKSMAAKKFGIVTGESLYSALIKCPHLKIVPPRFNVYLKASNSMVDILKEYTSIIERYSIDECFLDLGYISRAKALKISNEISGRIKNELGFTVNIGISTNKLLAKMASDFKKPDMIHTLFEEEIPKKMWVLPIDDLFMVGPHMAKKLKNMNIMTIGKLANTKRDIIVNHFMKYGVMIHAFANGIDLSPVYTDGDVETKGVGNSTTLPYDVTDIDTSRKTILSLLETLVPRLKKLNSRASCIKVYYTSTKFKTKSRQRVIPCPTDSLSELYKVMVELFDELWTLEPIRKIGIAVNNLVSNDAVQLSIFDLNLDKNKENLEFSKKKVKNKEVEETMEKIRSKFGDDSLVRATFLASPIKSHEGGIGEEGYIVLGTEL